MNQHVIMVDEVINIINDRIDHLKLDIKGLPQNCVAFGYIMGAIDELIYLKNDIKELQEIK